MKKTITTALLLLAVTTMCSAQSSFTISPITKTDTVEVKLLCVKRIPNCIGELECEHLTIKTAKVEVNYEQRSSWSSKCLSCRETNWFATEARFIENVNGCYTLEPASSN